MICPNCEAHMIYDKEASEFDCPNGCSSVPLENTSAEADTPPIGEDGTR